MIVTVKINVNLDDTLTLDTYHIRMIVLKQGRMGVFVKDVIAPIEVCTESGTELIEAWKQNDIKHTSQFN